MKEATPYERIEAVLLSQLELLESSMGGCSISLEIDKSMAMCEIAKTLVLLAKEDPVALR
ncbi:hypothetical protein ACH6CV_16825 [Bacillota bacterium Meth-B3]